MDEPRVNWERYGDVKNDTGFRAETLTYIYSKYCGEGTPIRDPHLLYRVTLNV